MRRKVNLVKQNINPSSICLFRAFDSSRDASSELIANKLNMNIPLKYEWEEKLVGPGYASSLEECSKAAQTHTYTHTSGRGKRLCLSFRYLA